jgi:dTDP-3-amino-3,4,6-trideoxy-alpha-D-glucose transaminase
MPEPILLNDFNRQWVDVRADVHDAVERVGRSGWYILGSAVAGFEASLATELGSRFCVGCASGLDAIELALRALGLRPGDRVLTTPLSAFATTLAIVRAGGVPVFVDVDEGGNLDLELAERCLAERRDVPFAVPVHLYGHPLDLDRLASVQSRYGLKIVEDCAQAIGAEVSGRAVGSVGDLSATSFYPTKNLGAFGDGGAVFGNDEGLAKICRALRNYGQTSRYVHERLGLNSRLDELHAAILDGALLPRLSAWSARRRAIAHRYREAIRGPRVVPLPLARPEASSWHLFPVLVEKERREAFQVHLQSRGVQSAVHYPKLIPDQAALADLPFEVAGSLHQARAIADSEVSLPIHPYLDDGEVESVIEAVNEWQPS